MITATYNPENATVRMECGIGETRCVQTIPATQYYVRQLNWPQKYPPVVHLELPA